MNASHLITPPSSRVYLVLLHGLFQVLYGFHLPSPLPLGLDFPAFCGHRYARFDMASHASGLTPLRWLCRRGRL